MAFVFTLPPIIAPKIEELSGLSPVASGIVAQLSSPVVCQVFSSALHLMGLDYYNRRNVDGAARVTFMKKEYGKTLVARMLRIFFPFSIGAVFNKNIRGYRPPGFRTN